MLGATRTAGPAGAEVGWRSPSAEGPVRKMRLPDGAQGRRFACPALHRSPASYRTCRRRARGPGGPRAGLWGAMRGRGHENCAGLSGYPGGVGEPQAGQEPRALPRGKSASPGALERRAPLPSGSGLRSASFSAPARRGGRLRGGGRGLCAGRGAGLTIAGRPRGCPASFQKARANCSRDLSSPPALRS